MNKLIRTPSGQYVDPLIIRSIRTFDNSIKANLYIDYGPRDGKVYTDIIEYNSIAEANAAKETFYEDVRAVCAQYWLLEKFGEVAAAYDELCTDQIELTATGLTGKSWERFVAKAKTIHENFLRRG